MSEHDESSLFSFLAVSASERDELIRDGSAARLPKSLLSVLAGAMKRSFASSLAQSLIAPTRAPAMILGLFQDGTYFERERARYGAFAAAGATTIVGYPGAPAELGGGIEGIDTAGRRELADAWVLAALAPAFGALVVARDERCVGEGATLEGSRRFELRWSFRRDDAIDSVRELLGSIRSRVSDRGLASVEAALREASALPVSLGEEQLATAIEAIVGGLGTLTSAVRRPAFSELDLLTGLPNARFLERFLGPWPTATSFTALLIDVDNLHMLNERHGPEAGDAALVTIARGLADECHPGELLVRYADDEFIVLATSSAHESPGSIADRFVVGVRALRMPYPFEHESVTASIGVALVERGELPIDELKAALEQAKEQGKNVAQVAEQ